MKDWLNNVVLHAFPKELRARINYITLPSYGMVFGHDYGKDFYNGHVGPDNDEQFEHFKRKAARVKDFKEESEKYDYLRSWWLSNTVREESSTGLFACVNADGSEGFSTSPFPEGGPVFEVSVNTECDIL